MVEEGTEYTTQRSGLSTSDSDYIKLRLDTQKIHADMYTYLKGFTKIVKFDSATNQYLEVLEKTGDPLANDTGIQFILNYVGAVINPHTIQGNTKQEDLDRNLKIMELQFAEQLTLNSSSWGISDNTRDMITDTIFSMISLVLSRTINNEERKSYSSGIDKVTSYKTGEKEKGRIF